MREDYQARVSSFFLNYSVRVVAFFPFTELILLPSDDEHSLTFRK